MASQKHKKLIYMAYGLEASIVILVHYSKIFTNWELGPLNGGVLLLFVWSTEALFFAIKVRFEPLEDEYDWSLVYPELSGGEGMARMQIPQLEIQESEAFII